MAQNKIIKQEAQVVPSDLVADVAIEGAEDSARLGRFAMYSGTAAEELKYGESGLKRGDFFDVLEARKISTPRIVLVGGEKFYVRWDEGSESPNYRISATKKGSISADDLVWGEDGEPPLAREQYEAVIIIEGEPWPYLWIIKGTALKAFDSVLLALDRRRQFGGQIKGLYELAAIDDKNKAGQPYKKLGIRPVGDMPESMWSLYRSAKAGLAQMRKNIVVERDDVAPF